MVQLLDMGFEIDQIEACQLALASSNSPLTLQAATEWWFACLILTFSLLAVFCFSSHSCPLSLLSTLPTVVCYVFESRFCCFFCFFLNYTNPSPTFCLLFLPFSKVASAGLPRCCPKFKVKRRHEAQVIYRQEWDTEDWRECNTRGSETILNHIQNVSLAYITTLL